MLRAGCGEADITPSVGLPLSGFAVRRDRPSVAVDDPLRVKVLAVEQMHQHILLLSFDLLGFDFELDAQIRGLLANQFPDQQVILTTTHTHSAPPTMPISGETRVPGSYIEMILSAAIRAVNQALAALADAELFHAAAELHGINLNRRQHYNLGKAAQDFDVDSIFDLFTFRTPGGLCQGSFVRFSCHAVTMTTQHISADYPGELTRRLAQLLGAPCLFLVGTAGDSNPTTHNLDHVAMCAFVDQIIDQLVDLPRRLEPVAVDNLSFAEQTFRLPFTPLPERAEVLETITRNERILAGDQISPDLQPLVREYQGWVARGDSDLTAAVEHWAGVFREAALRTLAAIDSSQPMPGAPFRIAGLALGLFTFVFLSGEVLTPVGRHIQDLRPNRQVKVISYLSPIVGYIADAADFDLGGYEPGSAWMWYRMPAPFPRDVMHRILPEVDQLLHTIGLEEE